MSKLVWDTVGERYYETGTKQGVLYRCDSDGNYSNGVAWNGLTAVTESPSGAEATDLYADDIKYLSVMSTEELGLTVESYSYPDEFAECDGSAEIAKGVVINQQDRKMFGLCYRTIIGNDVASNDYAYKLHLLYGCKASPSERAYSSINDSPDAITFSWEVNSTPVAVSGYNPTSIVTIDSRYANSTKLAALEDILYGADNAGEGILLDSSGEAILDSDGNTIDGIDYGTVARLPLPDEVISLMK